nr:HAMP domain-containing sensor histidine kinase [uncultured Romboutsia sp.]
MSKDNCYRVYKFPIKDSEDNVKLTGGMANEIIYSKYINKELEDLFNEVQKSENIEYTQSISRVLANLNNMIKSTSIDLFCINESKEKLDLCISCDKKNIFLKDSSINIDYREFSKLYDSKLKIDINNKLNYEFRKIYNNQVEINGNSVFKIIPLKIDGKLIGVIYIYYENKDECIDTYDGFIYDVLHRIGNFFNNIELKNELKEKLYISQEKAKHLEHEIDILEEAIESEMVKVNFLENMSHEFRTPINIILMISKLLLSSAENNDFNLDREKTINYLKSLKQNGYRILRLVNNILDSTEFDNKYKQLEMHNYNIISVIEDIVLSAADYIKNTERNIVFDTEEEEVILACRPSYIEKIMLNLISNSFKFTNDNGQIEIDIKVNQEEKKLYVHVKNGRPSIQKEDAQLIFNKFAQIENHIRRQNEGSGIGLYLVKCLVEAHGGKVWLNTEVESGAEFIFYLPIKTIDNEDDIKIYSIEEHSIMDKCSIEFSDVYSL